MYRSRKKHTHRASQFLKYLGRYWMGMFIVMFPFQCIATSSASRFVLNDIVISPDNKRLVYYRADLSDPKAPYIIRNINLQTGKTLTLATVQKQTPEGLKPFSLMPDADKLLLLDEQGVDVIHNKTGKLLRTLPVPVRNYIQNNLLSYPLQKTALSKNGNLLALPDWSWGAEKPTVYLINTGSKKIMHRIPMSYQYQKYGIGYRQGMAFTPDGRVLSWLTQGFGGNSENSRLYLYRYNFYLKKELEAIELKTDRDSLITGVRYSPNGQIVIVVGWNTVELIDLKSGEQVLINSKEGKFGFAGFTQDQKHLVLVDTLLNKITIRNILSGKETSVPVELEANKVLGGPFAQSKDLKYLAIGIQSSKASYQKDKVLLFNTQNGQLIRRFEFSVDKELVH